MGSYLLGFRQFLLSLLRPKLSSRLEKVDGLDDGPVQVGPIFSAFYPRIGQQRLEVDLLVAQVRRLAWRDALAATKPDLWG